MRSPLPERSRCRGGGEGVRQIHALAAVDLEQAFGVAALHTPRLLDRRPLPEVIGGAFDQALGERAQVPLRGVTHHQHLVGCRVEVEYGDVGAGFASFRHILQLSPDIVKLDLSLTRRLEDSSSARALTAALVDFADTTGAVIAAEGIESEVELTLLRELGVHHGQGYLLGYPAHLEAQLN